jgi:hypothetical protein
MTRATVREYAAAVRPRYPKACRGEKKHILDEFCRVTGYHPKSAIRLLCRRPREPTKGSKRRGRPQKFGPELVPVLQLAWEATDRICSKRFAPFFPELIPILERHKELQLSAEIRAKLLAVSASTIDRLLAPFRRRGGRRSLTTTRSVSALKAVIPIRTYAERKPSKVGYIGVDLAAHCGASSEGFYLNTLMAVDLVTGWTECVATWGKGQSRVGSAVDPVRRQLPFPLLGLNSDNGSEFVNHSLWDYCQRHAIDFTRSRAYKKNDQAHVEQKNWSVVRRLVGYDRYATKAAYRQLNYLYHLVSLYANFFQPICKLTDRRREGATVRKQYDRAQTPYQRLLSTRVLRKSQRRRLGAIYQVLNPVQLRKQIDEALRTLWEMSAPDPRAKAETAALAKIETSRNQITKLAKVTSKA